MTALMPSASSAFAVCTVIVFASILYLLAIFKGAGHLFQIFLGVPYEVAVGVTLLVVVLYTPSEASSPSFEQTPFKVCLCSSAR